MRVTIITLVCSAFSVLGCSSASDKCLRYEPSEVNLAGVIVRETHPGRPNYEDISRGDEPETIWVLKLNDITCLRRGGDFDDEEKEIKEIQLVLRSEHYKLYKALVGSKVSAKGTLFHSHTGHHHKKVLMVVKELTNMPNSRFDANRVLPRGAPGPSTAQPGH